MEKKYSEKAYSDAIAALMCAAPSFGAQGLAAYKPGLERALAMDRLLGGPSSRLRCIHVAGTNGKGSVCNMLAASLAAHGKKVGLYTSPHILDLRERIRIVHDGGCSLVPREWVFDFLNACGRTVKELGLTFFEITTAMCLKYFDEIGVDCAVMETGLGGRFDATNIITPEISVITNIGFDHMDILGDTLEKIAAEKAGIIKKGVPVVVGEYDPLTAPVFVDAARKAGCSIFFADRENGQDRDACADVLTPSEMNKMDLGGSYQKKNLRTVACVLRCLGYEPDAGTLENTAHICGFHARWEKIMDNPLTICDIGHNEHGLKYNFRQLAGMLEAGEVSDVMMVYGSVSDKDVDASLAIMPAGFHVIFTSAENPRAMGCRELLARYSSLFPSRPAPSAVPSVKDAVSLALEKCRGMKKPLLYIGGSTYVVAEALRSLSPIWESAE